MTAKLQIHPSHRVSGTVRVPGDKSISHRALMLGSIAEGVTSIEGFLPGEDCLATLAAMRAMGVTIDQHDAQRLTVHGRGLRGLRPPAAVLDMGNSGTAMRLLAGLLAGQSFSTQLTGDASLRRRPMERVAVPLRQMGAVIDTEQGRPPLAITGGQPLRGIRYELPMPSAQVKSAILLAGLYAAGETVVVEPAVSRDHTERMLATFGWPVRQDGPAVVVTGGARLQGAPLRVPGDLSSAAFLVLAACLAESGELMIEEVGLNPTRTGILDILRLMGADMDVQVTRGGPGEPVGVIRARPSALRGTVIPPGLVPLAIDEFPLVFVAAALAEGQTIVSGAEELRHKESDRIGVMAGTLRQLGVQVEERPDGAVIHGGRLRGGVVDSRGDHRVAMSLAIGAARAGGPVTILDTANVATSYPGFAAQARAIGAAIEARADG